MSRDWEAWVKNERTRKMLHEAKSKLTPVEFTELLQHCRQRGYPWDEHPPEPAAEAVRVAEVFDQAATDYATIEEQQ